MHKFSTLSELIPAGYAVDVARSEDIPHMISADRAASVLFEPTGLLDLQVLSDQVPAEVFKEAILVGHVHVMRGPDGEAVGFTLTSERGRSLYLDQVSVHPDHGQQGLGRALVMTVLMDAEQRGLPDVCLSTFKDLPWNGPFYASMGFREIPRTKLEDYMIEIEKAQMAFMDVTKRCFMRRKVRRSFFGLTRRKIA